MQVAQYTFQSPYSSPVQVGRLDPNSVKNNDSEKSFTPPNETQQKAQSVQNSLKQDVSATVSTNNKLLDVYA